MALTTNPLALGTIRLAQLASLTVATAGALVVAAWLLDIPSLTSLYLPGPTLKTNAALSLTCGALANLLLISGLKRGWRLAAYVLAAVPTLIGALTLSEHLVGWDLSIDQLIATEAAGALATVSPNRMGPPASTANVLLGVALFLGESRSRRWRGASHLLAFLTCLIALSPIVGYAYGIEELYSVAHYTGIALVTAVALLMLGVAVQAGRPDGGLVALICRQDEVGVFARRLVPAAALPFFIGWALARAIGAGVVSAPYAISAMALVLMIVMAGVIWRTGTQLVLSLDARAAAERALADSERTLRESDRQKTEFLATLSHELRNPLAPIRFAVQLLERPGTSADRARRTIERQVRHLTRLVDDLLDLSRITRNRLELNVKPSALAQLVHDAVDAVSDEIRSERRSLEIDLPLTATWLRVDPDRVVQMLVNLLTNAVRYSEPGGRILVGAAVQTEDVTIYVRDTGQGIAAADLERVFERFVQVGKARHGGLGIGLALVKAIAELHGGSVVALSDGPGHGAEFRISLPRAAAPPETELTRVASPIPSCRVLVVDDNRDAADMLGRLLTGEGHRVAIAYHGEDALRLASEFKPQVGLLDIGMAGIDGYELASRLRHHSDSSQLFLVAITGFGQAEDRRRALAAGFDAHLTKPANPEEIATLLAARFTGEPPGHTENAPQDVSERPS